MFDTLPPEQRVDDERAILRTEQVLLADDPRVGAEAMLDLRQQVLATVQHRG